MLDWELSTLGHPLADFAYHAMMYRMPPHIVAGLAGADLAALNIPSEAEYVAAYCAPHRARRPSRTTSSTIAFNFFRLAAIVHGIKGRVMRGTPPPAPMHANAPKPAHGRPSRPRGHGGLPLEFVAKGGKHAY